MLTVGLTTHRTVLLSTQPDQQAANSSYDDARCTPGPGGGSEDAHLHIASLRARHKAGRRLASSSVSPRQWWPAWTAALGGAWLGPALTVRRGLCGGGFLTAGSVSLCLYGHAWAVALGNGWLGLAAIA